MNPKDGLEVLEKKNISISPFDIRNSYRPAHSLNATPSFSVSVLSGNVSHLGCLYA
jgi:hypothetical protein